MTLDEFRQSLTATEPPAGLTHADVPRARDNFVAPLVAA